jgi:hypothetical protein
LNEALGIEKQPSGALTVRLQMQFTYRNHGKSRMIMPFRVRVSKLRIVNLHQGKEPIVVVFDRIPRPEIDPGDTLADLAEIVGPNGASQSISRDRSVYFRIDPQSEVKLDPDRLVNTLEVRFELIPVPLPGKYLRTAGVQPGTEILYWNKPTLTNSVVIDVPQHPEISDCTNLYRID